MFLNTHVQALVFSLHVSILPLVLACERSGHVW